MCPVNTEPLGCWAHWRLLHREGLCREPSLTGPPQVRPPPGPQRAEAWGGHTGPDPPREPQGSREPCPNLQPSLAKEGRVARCQESPFTQFLPTWAGPTEPLPSGQRGAEGGAGSAPSAASVVAGEPGPAPGVWSPSRAQSRGWLWWQPSPSLSRVPRHTRGHRAMTRGLGAVCGAHALSGSGPWCRVVAPGQASRRLRFRSPRCPVHGLPGPAGPPPARRAPPFTLVVKDAVLP